MNAHAEALALLDALAREGAWVELSDSGELELVGEPSDALIARLTAFCGDHETRAGLATYRALRAVVRASTRAARDLLTLPVTHSLGLPVPFTVRFRAGAQVCAATSSRHAYANALARGESVFLLREMESAAFGAPFPS